MRAQRCQLKWVGGSKIRARLGRGMAHKCALKRPTKMRLRKVHGSIHAAKKHVLAEIGRAHV